MVARAAPFHWTVEELMKFVPVRASVKPDPPTVAVLGLMLANVGTGFGGGGGALMMKIWPPEVPPSGAGLKTATITEPVEAMSVAVIAAVKVVLLTNVVVLEEPFHWTVELLMKFVPMTVRVKPGLPPRWLSSD